MYIGCGLDVFIAMYADKRKEYSAHAQPAAASSRGAEQPPLPVAENGRNVNLEQNSLYNEVSQTKSEESMAIRKRKQEKAAGSKKAKAVKLDKGTVSLISKWQVCPKLVFVFPRLQTIHLPPQ